MKKVESDFFGKTAGTNHIKREDHMIGWEDDKI
jgi:hypothetical protein